MRAHRRLHRVMLEGKLGLVLERAHHGPICSHFDSLPKHPHIALKLFGGAVEGIAHMHSRGFVHRDVKADNVLIFEGDVAKLCDFGFTLKEGKAGYGYGTRPYLSPEQIHDVCHVHSVVHLTLLLTVL